MQDKVNCLVLKFHLFQGIQKTEKVFDFWCEWFQALIQVLKVFSCS